MRCARTHGILVDAEPLALVRGDERTCVTGRGRGRHDKLGGGRRGVEARRLRRVTLQEVHEGGCTRRRRIGVLADVPHLVRGHIRGPRLVRNLALLHIVGRVEHGTCRASDRALANGLIGVLAVAVIALVGLVFVVNELVIEQLFDCLLVGLVFGRVPRRGV